MTAFERTHHSPVAASAGEGSGGRSGALVGGVPDRRSSLMLGVGPVVRKEIREWIATWRALMLVGVSTMMMVLNTISARLASMAGSRVGGVPSQLSMDPTYNVLVKWDQWVFFFAIAFTASLVVGERDRGTLAWSLSKPLSRSALLIGKWTGAMIVYVPLGLIVPMAACVVAASLAYGPVQVGPVVEATALLVSVPAFFFALTLALGSVLPSHLAVAGVAVGVAVLPGIIGSFLPDLATALPPVIGTWAIRVSLGAPVELLTPIGWLVGTVAVALAGLAAIRRQDL